jgi:hypothetical protein
MILLQLVEILGRRDRALRPATTLEECVLVRPTTTASNSSILEAPENRSDDSFYCAKRQKQRH